MDSPPESRFSLPLSEPIGASRAVRASTLEQEVTQLFEQLRDRILRYLLSFGLRPADGDEVVQEVFLALFLHLQKGRPRSNLRGWVFRVAHNLALKRRTQAGGDLRSWALQAPIEMPDPAPNAEEQMASNQQQQRLLAVLRALPEQDRQCLALRAEGLSYREIGDVLGVSLGTVATLLSRSLARLARADER